MRDHNDLPSTSCKNAGFATEHRIVFNVFPFYYWRVPFEQLLSVTPLGNM